MKLHAVVKPLNRAAGPLFEAFLGLKPHERTLDCEDCEFTA